MKTCVTCKQSKPFSEFHKHCAKKDGHQSICKTCTKIYHKANRNNARHKRYAHRHPERIQAKHAIERAIKNGILVRPDTLLCIGCGGQAKEYHHPSYLPERRLDVEPVCNKCHRQIHTNLKLGLSSSVGAFI